MKVPIDLDAPCWCGSERPFKDCHLDRRAQPRVNLNDILTDARKQYAATKHCLHPDAGKTCKGSIIQAHTIARKGCLSKIAEGGHVMNFNAPPAHIMKTDRTEASLIGIKDASVFTGFCGHHDSETFKPIEVQAIRPTEEHSFLLGYRAVCKELYERQIFVRVMPYLRNLDRGYPLENQKLLQYWLGRLVVWTTYRRDCILHHKQCYDTALQTHDFAEFRYYTIRFGACPNLMCSSAFCPRADFAGNLLQRGDRRSYLDTIACSIVAAEGGGLAVFHWLNQSPACGRFVQSLDAYTDGDLAQAIVRLCFYSFQNMYARPSWWNSLDHTTRANLLDRRSWGMRVKDAPQPNCYVDDGVRAATWTIEARETNYSFR